MTTEQTGELQITITERVLQEAVRNVTVFGSLRLNLVSAVFGPVSLAILYQSDQCTGWTLTGSEEIETVEGPDALALRKAYLTASTEYDLGRITAEQFRAAVMSFVDKVTAKDERNQMN